jgi:heptaprenyl diphosphate synthase
MAKSKEGDARIFREVPPSFLFFFGLALSPALWLQTHVAFKAAQVLLFFGLAAWARPGGWWRAGLASLVFLAVTVAVNLAVPLGRVLWRLGPWRITQGALESGLAKGLTLVGLAYLSRLCVRPELRLPGAAGRYVARTLFYLNRLLELRVRLSLARLGDSLDRVLESLWVQSPVRAASRARFSAGAVTLLAALAAINYGILFI